MNPLEQLFRDNADPSDTRYLILSPPEQVAILKAIEIMEQNIAQAKQSHPEDKKLLDDAFYLIGSQWHLVADIKNLLHLDRKNARSVKLSGQIWLQIKSQAATVENIKSNFARAYGTEIGQALAEEAQQPEENENATS